MNTKPLYIVFLSALPLSTDLQVETGCIYPFQLAVGPDLLIWKNLQAVRQVVGPDRIICPVLVLEDRSIFQATNFQFRFSFFERDPAIEKLEIVSGRGPGRSLSFVDSLGAVQDLFRGTLRPIDGSLVVLPADSLFSADSLHDLINASARSRVRALCTAADSGFSAFPEVPESQEKWTVVSSTSPTKPGPTWSVGHKLTRHGPLRPDDLLFTGASYFESSTDLFGAKDVEGYVKRTKQFDGAFRSPQAFFTYLFNVQGFPVTTKGKVFDFGHMDNYWNSRFSHLSTRTFNSIKGDFRRSRLIKKSKAGGLTDQKEWYRIASHTDEGSLQEFLPRVFPALPTALEIEAVPLLPLSESLFNPTFTDYHWGVAAVKMVEVLRLMYGAVGFSQSANSFGHACWEMYHEKTEVRLKTLLEQTPRSAKWQFQTSIGIRTLQDVLARLPEYVRKFGLHRAPSYRSTLIHGDPCFSNVLFDRRTLGLKLIDPRGKFGNSRSYLYGAGDLAYDLAKILHSSSFGYDLVLAGQTSVDGMGTPEPMVQASNFNAAFNSVLYSEIQKAVNKRRLPASLVARAESIVPLLFLSMLPLHSENIERTRALANIGVFSFFKKLS